MSTNFNNFWYKYFWHHWPSNDRPIYHLTQCLSAKKWTNEICVKMNKNTSETIPNIIVCDLKKDWQILIIFGANIFDNCPSNDCSSSHIT